MDKLTANQQNNNNGMLREGIELQKHSEVSQCCETQLINVHGNVSFIMEPLKF